MDPHGCIYQGSYRDGPGGGAALLGLPPARLGRLGSAFLLAFIDFFAYSTPFGFSATGGRDQLLGLTIEDFGGRVATVWSELRPATRKLVERALQPSQTATSSLARNLPYDARADLELSKLLTALDESGSDASLGPERSNQLRAVAETCAAVLQEKTQSAEVFAQLVQRAQLHRDYKRIDLLADALSSRFAPSEVCELVRSPDAVVRALAQEALVQMPTPVLVGVLHDPVDAALARDALRRQAIEYGSEEARQIVLALEQVDLDSEDL
jgi:hypothetical protein